MECLRPTAVVCVAAALAAPLLAPEEAELDLGDSTSKGLDQLQGAVARCKRQRTRCCWEGCE